MVWKYRVECMFRQYSTDCHQRKLRGCPFLRCKYSQEDNSHHLLRNMAMVESRFLRNNNVQKEHSLRYRLFLPHKYSHPDSRYHLLMDTVGEDSKPRQYDICQLRHIHPQNSLNHSGFLRHNNSRVDNSHHQLLHIQ